MDIIFFKEALGERRFFQCARYYALRYTQCFTVLIKCVLVSLRSTKFTESVYWMLSAVKNKTKHCEFNVQLLRMRLITLYTLATRVEFSETIPKGLQNAGNYTVHYCHSARNHHVIEPTMFGFPFEAQGCGLQSPVAVLCGFEWKQSVAKTLFRDLPIMVHFWFTSAGVSSLKRDNWVESGFSTCNGME